MFEASDHVELMLEITWILTNITSHTDLKVIDYITNPKFGLINFLLKMAQHQDGKIREHWFWSIANLCQQDDPERLNELASSDLLNIINDNLSAKDINLGLMRTIAWCVSNLMNYSHMNKDFIRISVDISSSLLFTLDSVTQTDICYGFLHLMQNDSLNEELENYKVNWIVEAIIIPKLIELLKPGTPMFAPALRTVGELSSFKHQLVESIVSESGIFMKCKS